MKKTFTLLVVTVLHFSTFGQCTETPKDKILLVGDSWAFFMNVDGTINSVSKDWGHSNVQYYTNLTLSENGAETDDFLLPAKVSELTMRLNTMPDLEVVHLSIGGNDFLGNWNVNFTEAQTTILADQVIGRLDSIVDIIHTTRPDVHVFWSGYVYANFGEVIGSMSPFLQSAHPFYGTWEGMGFPSFTQLNTVQNWFQNRISTHYATDNKFTYIHAPALMQYVFGQTAALEVTPFGTYAPFTVNLPEGNLNYPSPKSTMRDYGITKDCFHLSVAGYNAFIAHHFQKFYHKFLMDDAYSIATFSKSGHVSNSGATSNEIIVGKNGATTTAAIIDLDNTHIDSYAPEKLALFFKIEEMSGTNLFENGLLTAEIIEGNFGGSSNLEAADYASIAATMAIPCVFGNPSVGKWVRLEFPASFNDYVRQSNSQIRLKYTGASDAHLKFANSTDPDFQATLNILYGESTVSIATANPTPLLTLFPNPAQNTLNLKASTNIDRVEIYTVTGELIQVTNGTISSIDISQLANGMYLLNAFIGEQMETIRFVKE